MSVILTRVRLPQRRKDFLRRVRLLDLLHRTLHRKLTFISAPAGYGKTTLLLDFAADVDATVCWYSIGTEQAELAVFYEHLVVAIQQRFPDFGTHLTELLQTPAGRDPHALGLELVNEMVAQVSDYSVLMLDDYHMVGEAPAIVALLETVLDNLPDHVRLVIAGRSVYGIPAPRLYVGDELSVLNVEQLRFRADELQALLRQIQHKILTEAQAEELLAAADGWIAALLLAARSPERGAWPALTGAREHFYTYLADEVLEQQAPAMRRLLLATAIVDEFNESFCQHLLELDSVSGLLRELGERNLFITQIQSDEGISYRYHQLFAEFLRERLWTTQPDWARALNRRAAEWFAERDDWERAVRHWLAIGERDKAARLMDRAAPLLYVAGRAQLLGQWVEALTTPQDLLELAPRLAIAQAKCLIDQGNMGERAEHLLTLAEARLQVEGDTDQWVNALITHGILRLGQNRLTDAAQLARTAQSVLDSTDNYRWYQIKRLESSCAIRQGDFQAAIAGSQIAVDGFRQLAAAHDLALALSQLALAWWQQENLFETQRCLVEALAIQRQLGHRIALVESINNLAYLYHQTGRYLEAWKLYEEALVLAKTAQATRGLALIQNGRGDFLSEFEVWDDAQAAYMMARDINEKLEDWEGQAYTYHGLAELERRQGHFNEALHAWREAARLRGESPTAPRYQAGLGAIYLDMGQYELAHETLTQALKDWSSTPHFQPERALAHLRLAQLEFRANLTASALAQFSEALRIAARFGSDQFLLAQARRAQLLLTYAAEQWPEQAQLHSLLKRVEQFQTGLAQFAVSDTAQAQAPTPNLEVLAFGPGRVRRNGELVPNSVWSSSRSRALFIYITERGRVSKEDVALAFWPDYSPAKVSSNFHATLWRIRHALGPDVVVFNNDHYHLAPQVEVWYDVNEFETNLRQADSPALTPDERADKWRQAVELYEDDYLKDTSLEWADQRRHELQAHFLVTLNRLAEWERNRKHYEAAQGWFEKVIDLDPYHDEAHAGIMDCLTRRGFHDAARAHFIAHEKRLRTDLSTSPPSFLRELYDQLRHL